jgi:hypothetical protein
MNPRVLNPDVEPSPEEIQLAVLERIRVAIENELVELEQARKTRPVNAVAWISRNLAELCIWAQYCVDSAQNAKGFFDDAALDSLDMLKMPAGLFAKDPTYSFQAERERIIKEGKEKGAGGLDGSPSRVNEAASKMGKGASSSGQTSTCPSSLILRRFGSCIPTRISSSCDPSFIRAASTTAMVRCGSLTGSWLTGNDSGARAPDRRARRRKPLLLVAAL